MLDPITSPALAPFRHGFFTRKGGASSGIFRGLNCGPGSSDLAEVVAINRARVALSMGVEPALLLTVTQTHSPDVLTVHGPHPDIATNPRPVADAMVTATPGVALAVLTADCQPVLFAEAAAGVIGAAHAGWRGAKAGVLEATVAAMEALGARRDAITAVIGPTISQSAYEVGPDFMAALILDTPEAARFFAPGAAGRPMFDLPGYGLHRLRATGIGHAEWTGHCTYSEPDRFFSYRRSTHANEADYGRLISAITL